MKRMGLVSLGIAISLLLSLLAGCGAKDIDKRYFVVSMGIDPAQGKPDWIAVSLKLAIPKSKTTHGSSEFVMMTMEDPTISGAVNRIKTLVDKELDFGHMKLVVFGEEMAKKGIMPYLDWMQRHRDIQKICWMALGIPNAKEVLEEKPTSERYPSNNLFLTFGYTGSESDLALSEYLFAFYREVTEPGVDPVMPIIRKVSQGLAIDSSAAFKDDKLAFPMTPAETRVYSILKGFVRKPLLTVEFQEKDPFAYAAIMGGRVYAAYRITEGVTPAAEIELRFKGIMSEVQPHGQITGEKLRLIEAAAGDKLNKQTESFLKKCQEKGIDPVGFGLRYRSTHWNNDQEQEMWKKLYPELVFKITSKVKIESPGTSK